MGSVFDKDILYGGLRLDEEFPYGTGLEEAATVILYNAKVLGELDLPDSEVGSATKTGLVVASLDDPANPKVVGTLSGPIAQRFATVDDLTADPRMPAVVAIFKAPSKKTGHNDATVLQYVRTWDGDKPERLPNLEAVNEVPF